MRDLKILSLAMALSAAACLTEVSPGGGAGGTAQSGGGGTFSSGAGGRASSGGGGTFSSGAGGVLSSGGGGSTTASCPNLGSTPISGVSMSSTCAGYGTAGSYRGWWYTYSDKSTGGSSTICPDCTAAGCTPKLTTAVCAAGTVGKIIGTAYSTYWGAALAWSLNEPINTTTCASAGTASTVDLTGKTIKATFQGAPSAFRVELEVAGANLCVDISGQSSIAIPVSSFKNECWTGGANTPITPAQAAAVKSIRFSVQSNSSASLAYSFCVTSLSIEGGSSGGAGGTTSGAGGATSGAGGATSGAGGATSGAGGTGGTLGSGYQTYAGGYVSSCPLKGYAWTAAVTSSAAGAGTSTISPASFSTLTAGGILCASGSVGASSDYGGVGMLGWNVNQASGTGTTASTWTPTGTGLTYSIGNPGGSPLRIQLEDASGTAAGRWCYTLPTGASASGTIPWNSFNTTCWTTGGAAYNGTTPIKVVSVMVPGGNTAAVPFNFCVNSMTVAGASGSCSSGGSGGATGSGGWTGAGGSGAGGSGSGGSGAGGSGSGGSGSGGSGAGGSGAGGTTMSGSGTLSGLQSAQVTANGRQYIVQANSWGNGTTTLTYNGTAFTITGQTGTGSSAPASYPSVFIGNNNNRSTTGSNLPRQISAMTSVMTSWSWSSSGVSGEYNAAYDVWFTNSASGNISAPDKYLMVWLHDPASKQPRGSVIATGRTLTGLPGTWDVWSDGQCISYVATSDIFSLTYDLKTFINDAVSRGVLTSSMYLHDVFAGFEIWSGGVGLKTTNFTVVVN